MSYIEFYEMLLVDKKLLKATPPAASAATCSLFGPRGPSTTAMDNS